MPDRPFSALMPRAGGLTLKADAVARAEAALKAMSDQFSGWLADELDKLDAARAALSGGDLTGPEGEALYTRAHDLKGLGGTYGYPLITRIAGSLCRLIDRPEKRATAPLDLVDAHIAAIRRCAAENLRDEESPDGAALAEGLEARASAARGPA